MPGDRARVAVWNIDRKAGEDIIRDICAAAAKRPFIEADLAGSTAIEAAVAHTLKSFGVPYCIVNNASIYPRASLIEMAPGLRERTCR